MTTTIATTLAALSIKKMVELQNEMVVTAKSLGMAGSNIVARKAFHDRGDATTAVTSLHNDIEAWRAKHPSSVAGGAKSTSDTTNQPATVSPGLARLRASQDAEKLRLDTEAQGKAAIEKVAAERQPKTKEPEVAKKVKEPKSAKVKKEKPVKEASETVGRGRASAIIDTTGKVHLVLKDNPKRGECRNRYDLYRDGMLVETYISKVGNRIIAMGDLRWDMRHGFIEIVSKPEA